jgi:hypothetical protein
MDRATIEKHLVIVEGHVARGLEHLARQVEIIAALKGGDHVAAAEDALKLLKLLQEMQVQHEAHRDRLLRQLQEVD